MRERRRHPRIQPAHEIAGKVKSTMDFHVVDISEGGVLVETAVGLPPATVCELKVTALNDEVNLKAEVRRCRAQLSKSDGKCSVAYRSGLEFVNMNDHQREAVHRLITECCRPGTVDEGGLPATEGAVVSGSLYTV